MSRAYYNEIEPFAAAWLRNLMSAGLIPEGEVDERSILDVRPDDLNGFRQCHFFAGIAGWSRAFSLAGWSEDREVWSGSCPCQPISCAGKQKGADDERHLWPAFYSLISKRRPPVIFGEQVAGALGREWFSGVRSDLEDLGYACGAADLCAASVGAPHIRQRIFWVASDTKRDEQPREKSRSGEIGRMGGQFKSISWDRNWEGALSAFRALDDGLPRCVGGTDAARNAIVPQVAAEFISAVMECRP